MLAVAIRSLPILLGICAAPATIAAAQHEPVFSKKTYTYKKLDETEIHADVYTLGGEKTRPVVVWIHGGALIVGSRKSVPQQLLDLCRTAGFVLVSIDYRLAPEVKLPAIIEDVQDAFRWIHEQGPKLFAADPKKIVVTGGSAGGYLTMMTGICVRPRPTALVAYWGYGDVDGDWYAKPSDYYRNEVTLVSKEEAEQAVGGPVLTNTDGESSQPKARGRYYHYLRQNGLWPKQVVGFAPDTERKKFDPFCPIRNITVEYPPILMLHGTADTDVPYEQSAAMAKELARQGARHELITVPGAGHGLAGGDKELVDEAHARVAAFIRERLK